MDNRELSKYLATGEFTQVEASAEDAAVAVVTVENKDPFFGLLANLCAVEMLAKDYHYRCMGKAFYGEHLLADIIHDVGEKADDIFEIRYMGELQATPPFKADVARAAVKIIDELPMMANENGLIEALYDRTNALVGLVEAAKELKPASGTTAVLDAISEKALQSVGFLKRVMTGDDMAVGVDADDASDIGATHGAKYMEMVAQDAGLRKEYPYVGSENSGSVNDFVSKKHSDLDSAKLPNKTSSAHRLSDGLNNLVHGDGLSHGVTPVRVRDGKVVGGKSLLARNGDDGKRRHADGSVCKAASPETCPFNKSAEAGEMEITGKEKHS